MDLTKEAAHLYVYSKRLININKELKQLAKKLQKHRRKLEKARAEKKHNHQQKHLKTTAEIKNLLKKHNLILKKLHYHYNCFARALQKEHKI